MHPVRTILGKTTAAGLLIPAFRKCTAGYCRAKFSDPPDGAYRESLLSYRVRRGPKRAKVIFASWLHRRLEIAFIHRRCVCAGARSVSHTLGAPRGREATELVIAAGIAESLPLP